MDPIVSLIVGPFAVWALCALFGLWTLEPLHGGDADGEGGDGD